MNDTAAAAQARNTELNEREFRERKLVLESTPQRVFMQLNAPCNADCVFCSKGTDYPAFSLDEHLQGWGGRLEPAISRARELILSGSGEFLALPDAERILEHFNERFPHVDKYVATNLTHDRPRIWELIAASRSRYTLQVSLHAATPQTHRLMTRTKLHPKVLSNLRYLIEQKRKTGNPRLVLMFIMTTLNVEELPDFVRLGAELGADRVTAGYFYVYEAGQKYLSLYYRPELANRVIDEARRVAVELKMEVQLPPKFGEPVPAGSAPDCCPEPWSQIMVNPDGRILPCDVYGDFSESLARRSFAEIWNGAAYQEARRALSAGGGCLKTCPRQNPS
ncbi:MAG: radical SAM protein, partial [Elusimicrobia bacterium]|nr:radical SAM protein [Elusimicrobiota bacterium]